jgi:hypothetical protein
MGYPWDPLLMALDMYATARRLVFRGCMGPCMMARRGIEAGSATATRQLFLVMLRALDRRHAQYSTVWWCVKVGDVSATVPGKGDDAVVDLAVQVFDSIRAELQGQCSLPLAENKNTVVATKAEIAVPVATRLGPCAEVGSWCRKLGADLRPRCAQLAETARRPWRQARWRSAAQG